MEELHLGEVRITTSSEPWRVSEHWRVNGTPLIFKVDKGADVTAVPLKDYHRDTVGPLETTNQALTGPGQVPIDTAGYFKATVEWRNARIQEKVFVIKRLREALLSRSAVVTGHSAAAARVGRNARV
ncbi:hypothetical protein MTO96_042421 [Rhipicephalus appendiculatus]